MARLLVHDGTDTKIITADVALEASTNVPPLITAWDFSVTEWDGEKALKRMKPALPEKPTLAPRSKHAGGHTQKKARNQKGRKRC